MPTYEYECEHRHRFERRQSFHEEPVAVCPTCNSKARRVIHSVPVLFKGSGWYVTDYGGRNDDSPSSEKKSEKPEAKAEAATPKPSTSTSSSDQSKE